MRFPPTYISHPYRTIKPPCWAAIKENYADKAKLCYIDTDSSSYILKLKISMKILKTVETRFDTSNYKIERELTIEKNKKSNGYGE